MGSIYLENDCGVPRLACTDCGNCGSIMGISLCNVINRGCCHHFPEFTLVDIHRMTLISGGMEALNIILQNPCSIVNNFNIHAKGIFDREGYENYIKDGQLIETGPIRDHTIFFKTCPFVKTGSGCILPPRFRTTVCNFFICREILEHPDHVFDFEQLIEERSRYSRWIYRESGELQHILVKNGVNLVLDFDGSLKILREIPLSIYEFPELPPVNY